MALSTTSSFARLRAGWSLVSKEGDAGRLSEEPLADAQCDVLDVGRDTEWLRKASLISSGTLVVTVVVKGGQAEVYRMKPLLPNRVTLID
jgi:hypothetical protein